MKRLAIGNINKMGSRKNNLFVYRGGKSGQAEKIWELLGDPVHYFEPFGGSLSVILNRPKNHKNIGNGFERANDTDCGIINFFRCCKTKKHILIEKFKTDSMPKSHIEAISYVKSLKDNNNLLKKYLIEDPNNCDIDMAYRFCYAHSAILNTIGCGEIKGDGNYKTGGFQYFNNGVFDRKKNAEEIINKIHKRLKNVTLYCNDWKFCIPPKSVYKKKLKAGIYLDPPYINEGHTYDNKCENFIQDLKKIIIDEMEQGVTLVVSGNEGDYSELKELKNISYEEYLWERPQQNNRSNTITECLIKITK